MDGIWELMVADQQEKQLQTILSCNEKSGKYGLQLTEDDARELLAGRKESLKESQRVEFGGGILEELIEAFCDSVYVNQQNYKEILDQLQELFYLYKNESQDQLTDSELIGFMRKHFDDVCFGDVDYLGGTCLDRFARAIRAGYQTQDQQGLRDEYALRDTENEYEQWDEESRWSYDLYWQTLEDLF
ncbi:hypothetical protein Ami103574_07645 [Aminipila butyrica]|uniref:Uncharacterized protein n=1 Tax=Aminipila butyrica TaxID=433296 RepID=A0A858BTE5_9FIRM|nr:DUF6323 family protein [Aminipila butyrica]QIB69203.1 hypothetical protein Ami103574_07645 [Aminipila butyrica]